MSQEGQKDHQGQQPPEPRPVHPAIMQKARSVQVHQSWDREPEKQVICQGHQTVKHPSLTLSGCWLKSLATLIFGKLDVINVSLVTGNNATIYNVYIPYITHLICIYCTLYHLLHLAYAAWPSLIHIFICTYSYSFLYTCAYKGVVVKLFDYLLM
jgi:hypothetical protein